MNWAIHCRVDTNCIAIMANSVGIVMGVCSYIHSYHYVVKVALLTTHYH